MNAPRNFTIRARYTKRGKVRFTSHRDVARLFERAIRVVGMPVAYSEGFSPRPRLSFGLALPTTFESDAEYVDIILSDPQDPARYVDLLTRALPEGIDVEEVAILAPGTDSLQESVAVTSWYLEVKGSSADEVASWAQAVMDQPSITITQERKGKQTEVDVRPAIRELKLAESASADPELVAIGAELATKPRALRPAELLRINDPSFELFRGRRMHQWTTTDGARRDPIAAGAAQESTQGLAHAS